MVLLGNKESPLLVLDEKSDLLNGGVRKMRLKVDRELHGMGVPLTEVLNVDEMLS